MNVGIPPRSLNHRLPAACEAPTASAASSLLNPLAIFMPERIEPWRMDSGIQSAMTVQPRRNRHRSGGEMIRTRAMSGLTLTSALTM
jgi:hypothetical protein